MDSVQRPSKNSKNFSITSSDRLTFFYLAVDIIESYIGGFNTHAVYYLIAMENLTVTDGGTVEDCEVVNEYSHYGHEIAEVRGETISGFVFVN